MKEPKFTVTGEVVEIRQLGNNTSVVLNSKSVHNDFAYEGIAQFFVGDIIQADLKMDWCRAWELTDWHLENVRVVKSG